MRCAGEVVHNMISIHAFGTARMQQNLGSISNEHYCYHREARRNRNARSRVFAYGTCSKPVRLMRHGKLAIGNSWK